MKKGIDAMSIFAAALRAAYRLSSAKKAFGLPEDEIRKVIDKQNRSRGVLAANRSPRKITSSKNPTQSIHTIRQTVSAGA